MAVHGPGTPDREKRPRGALLQPVVETWLGMRRVGGSEEAVVPAAVDATLKHRLKGRGFGKFIEPFEK